MAEVDAVLSHHDAVQNFKKAASNDMNAAMDDAIKGDMAGATAHFINPVVPVVTAKVAIVNTVKDLKKGDFKQAGKDAFTATISTAAVVAVALPIKGVFTAGAGADAAATTTADIVDSTTSAATDAAAAPTPADGLCNTTDRPAIEGDTNYQVNNPADHADTITDIDRIQNGTLWEEKSATGQHPNMNIEKWVAKNVTTKLNAILRARQYMPGFENAPIGLDFTEPGATPAFMSAVEQAAGEWRAANPGVSMTVRWTK